MSGCKGCGCGQASVVADPFSEFSGSGGAADLANWWPDDGGAALSGVDAFAAMGVDGAAAGVEDEALAELAAVELEDELAAEQELSDVEQEAQALGEGEASLDDLLAIARARPGLKITFSY